MREATARGLAAAVGFRAAVAADAGAILALVESAYRGEASKAGWTTEAELLGGQRIDLAGVHEAIAADGSVIVLAERAGEPIGCARLERAREACWFGLFAVRPLAQRGGTGSALLAECERFARETWGCREMRMCVLWMREELLAYYRRRGYRDTGERKPFPYGDERFGLPKRADLHFQVLAKTLRGAA